MTEQKTPSVLKTAQQSEIQAEKKLIRRNFIVAEEEIVPSPTIAKVQGVFEWVIGSLNGLFNKMTGTAYTPQFQLSLLQKQKILDYISFSNLNITRELQQHAKKPVLLTKTPKPDRELTTKEALVLARKVYKDKLQEQGQLEDSAKALRVNYINELGYQMKRMRFVSNGYGIVFGSMLCLSWMRFSSPVRKVACVAFFAHVFGQMSTYRNIDRLFDKVQPIFLADVKRQLEMERKLGTEAIHLENLEKIIKIFEGHSKKSFRKHVQPVGSPRK